jgi:large repetitive protein
MLYLVFFATIAHAQPHQVSSGLSYLATSQNPDGTWNTSTQVETTEATVSVLESLKTLNQTAGTPYTTGVSWLQSQSPATVDYQAQRIHALGLTDTSINTLIPQLDQLKHAWGGDDGYETDNLDTASALQALKSANYTDQTIIFGAIKYLLSTQNTDGGWGFVLDDDSNVFVTAQVVSTLAQYKGTFQMNTQLASAAAFLLSKQNADGGIASSPSTAYETALGFIALTESGQTQGLPLQNAINYLTTTQSTNGSWNDDPYSTALALRALSNVKPDLSVLPANIAVLPATPTVGGSITVTATITNIGLEAASNVTVRLLDNGTTAGEQTIASIVPGGTGQATFAISPLTPVGEHILTIAVDPANAITETNKANNSATLRIWAKAPADLVVLPEYLTVTPAYPKPGESVTLTAKIANMGENDAGVFTADLYDGDPNNGGTKLGTFSNPGIVAGQWGNASFSFSLAATGSHTLYLVVDPQHSVTETSVTNNTARKVVSVSTTGGAGFIDLTIPMNGLSITPPRPHAGDTVTVTLLANNLGTEAASADVELFDGNPASGGVQLYKSSVSLNAGESRIITVPWQIPSGVHTLYASIDRANAVIERDKTNNSQQLAVMTDMVDIEVSASDLSITPEHPMDGDPATVKVVIHNRGIAATGAFNVNLYNGDPNSGGTLLQAFAITDLAGDATQTISYPFTAARGAYRFYAVCDPENKVTELYEDNNLAIRSLLVKTSAEAKGPDLAPLEFDLSGATTDPQSLRISGTATVKFQNKGDDKVNTPFRITVFEDKDGDGVYTEGTDLTLGSWDYATPMNPNMAGVVTISLSGTVTFRDAPIFAMLDSGQVVFEQNKGNNTIRKGSACEARPTNPIEPVVKWRWKGATQPIYYAPVVMSLTDTNGDGKIDDQDVPTIVFGYTPYVPGGLATSKIIALRGDTGQEVFSIYDSVNHPISGATRIAAGDIDGDGLPELVVTRITNGYPGLLAFNHDGTLKWDNLQSVKNYYTNNAPAFLTLSELSVPQLVDLNKDGNPVIVVGPSVYNAGGSIKWVSNDIRALPGGSGVGTYEEYQYSSIVADLDLDGKNVIVAGNTAYNADGTIKWWNKSVWTLELQRRLPAVKAGRGAVL